MDAAKSSVGDESLRTEVKGQAYAERARSYWALVNLYGVPYSEANKDKPGVAILLKNDLMQQGSRATVEEVYGQICEDLNIAEGLVPVTVGDQEKILPCRMGVAAFKARVYLYMNQLDSAEAAINRAFQRSPVFSDYNDFISDKDLTSTAKPWKGNGQRPTKTNTNPEIIWSGGLNYYSFWFNAIYIPQDLEILFDKEHDLRFLFDYGTTNPITGKVYPETSYFARGQVRTYMISTPEMYLVRAEILARKGNASGAMEALNELRKHRFLKDDSNEFYYELTASNATEALQKVKEERMREFACTSFSWFDLRRYQAYGEMVPAFTRTIGGETVILEPNSNLYTLSIPRYVIGKNPNIVQNPR